MKRTVFCSFILATTLFFSACGGGGGGGSSGGASSGWQSGVFAPSQNFAAQCATPRSGIDPYTNAAYPDTPGSELTENEWLRSWTNELYLWYDEVADVDPAGYSTPDYFDLLKTTALLPSGARKDRFHFTYATAEWEALSSSGVEPSYGLLWSIVAQTPPRKLVVGYIEPQAPAATTATGIRRGAEILTIDGIDLVNTTDNDDIDKLNAALSPVTVGEMHTFGIRDPDTATTRNVVLQAAAVTSDPAPTGTIITTISGDVGYLLFNAHIAPAESELISAVNGLNAIHISDLILDMRYNGGGYLDIASELAYMIAGPTPTANAIFASIHFNAKYPGLNPVTNTALTPEPFLDVAQGFSASAGQALPTLNLSRVFVLTGPETCSASEALINALRGVGVEVIQIGGETCGKPYGFYPQDNCGTTYFSIEFQLTNALGFGDYDEGFSPNNDYAGNGVKLPGCAVADDFSHQLGDSAEARLAAALNYRLTQTCPTPSSTLAPTLLRPLPAGTGGAIELSPWHRNQILR